MSRYTDYDALMDRLDFCVKTGMGSTIAFTFKHIVDETPSIDIVHCKECKHRDKFGCHNPIWGDGWANYPPPNPSDDDFCSYGERR